MKWVGFQANLQKLLFYCKNCYKLAPLIKNNYKSSNLEKHFYNKECLKRDFLCRNILILNMINNKRRKCRKFSGILPVPTENSIWHK